MLRQADDQPANNIDDKNDNGGNRIAFDEFRSTIHCTVKIRFLGDFLAAGCHKWLFGPRGTGVLFGRRFGVLQPAIPSFLEDEVFNAWLGGQPPANPPTAARVTPGGFQAFEHRWAMTDAFRLQREWGKARVEARTRTLAGQLKEGLAAMSGVTLVTPQDPAWSAGIVSFDMDAYSPANVVARLRDQNIIASVAPYARPHVRLTPSVRNTPAEIEAVLSELRALASA